MDRHCWPVANCWAKAAHGLLEPSPRECMDHPSSDGARKMCLRGAVDRPEAAAGLVRKPLVGRTDSRLRAVLEGTLFSKAPKGELTLLGLCVCEPPA